MNPISLDSETHKWREGCLAPPIVCASWACGDEQGLAAQGDADGDLRLCIDQVFAKGQPVVFCNAAYDLTVFCAEWPGMFPKVFAALEAGQIHDVAIREKLLQLSTSGDLEFAFLPDGSKIKLNYALSELEAIYGIDLGVDRRAEKKGEDAFRENYEPLTNVPLSDWPQEFIDYPMRDASGTLQVWYAQERRLAEQPGASVAEQNERVAAEFCLRLNTCWGFAADLEMRDRLARLVASELVPERIGLLLKNGILRPEVPPRQITRKGQNVWTKGVKSSICEKELHRLILDVCVKNTLDVKRTPAAKDCQDCTADWPCLEHVSQDKEVLERTAPFDPTLEQFQHRQYLQKLISTDLPAISGPVVFPNYSVLVETGRTSSWGSDGYSSTNIQNVSTVRKVEHDDGTKVLINVRHCFVARPGHLLCSVDYKSIEFVSMAQKCYGLFGWSVMRDVINEGIDPHAWLGSQLALHLDSDFAGHCQAQGASAPRDVLTQFLAAKESDPAFFKKYRALAKPVGFGYPGGLGPKKFIEFARKDPYRIVVSFEEAQTLKEIWFDTYPEIREYFRWITECCVDGLNPPRHDENGRRQDLYRYQNPLGLVRGGATYTSACNGALLQGPAADGAILAIFDVVRACYDETVCSSLLGCHMVAFVHDDIVLEIPDDELRHERAYEQAGRQIAAMKRVMPDVVVRAEPALMRIWDKDCASVYDVNGRLSVWEPKEVAQ